MPSSQLWYFLSKNNRERGFTLIELLIVVIIVGILAAIALPSLLSQVGKARESEAKNTIATTNRAQQAYFMEKSNFATTFAALEIVVDNQNYYSYSLASLAKGVIFAYGKDNLKQGTRNYGGGVQYASSNRSFDTIHCRSSVGPDYTVLSLNNAGVVTSHALTKLACGGGSEQVK